MQDVMAMFKMRWNRASSAESTISTRLGVGLPAVVAQSGPDASSVMVKLLDSRW